MEVQLLHELGYKIADSQKDLTREQKLFLVESRKYFNSKISEQSSGEGSGRKDRMNKLRQSLKQGG